MIKFLIYLHFFPHLWGLRCLPSPLRFSRACPHLSISSLFTTESSLFTSCTFNHLLLSLPLLFMLGKVSLQPHAQLLYHPPFTASSETSNNGKQLWCECALTPISLSDQYKLIFSLYSPLCLYISVVSYHTLQICLHNIYKASCRIERKYLK